jgi:hypothetical protein
LPTVLSITFREEQRLKVFDNRVLKVLFDQRDQIVVGLRTLLNEELRNLYSSSSTIISIIRNKVKEDVMGRACSTNG